MSYARIDSESGDSAEVLGKTPEGRLTYTGEGYMHVLMMPDGRAEFPSGDVFGTDEELLAAAGHFVAYCGRFEVKDDTILHHADLSFFPNWVGKAMVRKAKLEGNRLTLTSEKQVRGGRESTAVIVWDRDG
ncbi:MAG: lipocalin-like domain-containing protein [Proteobacteria bacterium]|nr:lipocalin-like domain-containing protein [Pseudomonadota bacterium]